MLNLHRDMVHTVYILCTPVVCIHTHGSVHFYDPEVMCHNYLIQTVAFHQSIENQALVVLEKS